MILLMNTAFQSILVLVMAVTAIFLSFTQLFIVLFVLGAVEANVSAAELMAVTLLFMGVLMLLNVARSYFSSRTQFGRIEVRLIIGSMIQNKALGGAFGVGRIVQYVSAIISLSGGLSMLIGVGRMDETISEKSAVFISHRLSSCRFCNDIAVFDEGRLIQCGSHEELAADESGKYYELWNAQAQYYIT